VITREDLLTPRILYGIAGVLVVLGLGLRVAPARVSAAQPALRLPPAVQASDPGSTGDERSYAPVAAANVFSQTRTPPKVRFVPEGRPEPAPAPASQRPQAPALRLYGITAGGRGTIALIDGDPKIPGAELYRVGDRIGSAQITSITDSTVELSREGGSLILRLPSSRRSPR
jgi:hypothetical protein